MAYLHKSDQFLPAISLRAPSDLSARKALLRAEKVAPPAAPRREMMPKGLWLYLGFAILLVAAYFRLDHYFEEPAMTFLVVMIGALPIWAIIAPRAPVARR